MCTNICTISTKTSSLFPKQGDQNAKRTNYKQNSLSFNMHFVRASRSFHHTAKMLHRRPYTIMKAEAGDICDTLVGIQSHSIWLIHYGKHRQGGSCPAESRGIRDWQLSLHLADHSLGVIVMINDQEWKSLQYRRQHAKAVMIFRSVHSRVAIPATSHLQILGAATRGHRCTYKFLHCLSFYFPILQDKYLQKNLALDCGTSCQRNWLVLVPLT